MEGGEKLCDVVYLAGVALVVDSTVMYGDRGMPDLHCFQGFHPSLVDTIIHSN